MTTDPIDDPTSPDPRAPVHALRFRDVSMVFADGTHAIDRVTFDVSAGEFVTVVGPSGCGKSTLLRIEVTELAGLEGHEKKYPKQLSGGLQLRCSLARSLVMDPQLFLFDEPFGALDEITRERLNDELLRLFNSIGFAALFITHSISEAVLSTRVVMSDRPGRVVCDALKDARA